MRGRAPRGVTGELSPASVYVSLLPVVEACVVVAVPGRVEFNLIGTVNSGCCYRGVPRGLSPASVYVSLLPDINLYFIMCGYLCYADELG